MHSSFVILRFYTRYRPRGIEISNGKVLLTPVAVYTCRHEIIGRGESTVVHGDDFTIDTTRGKAPHLTPCIERVYACSDGKETEAFQKEQETETPDGRDRQEGEEVMTGG